MSLFSNILGKKDNEDNLPEPNIRWPPLSNLKEYHKFAEWAAWYSGDPIQLSDVYSSLVNTGDVQGRIWSDEIEEEVKTMLHVPLAGDIAGVSADLLFGDPPDVKIPEAHEEGDSNNQDAIEAQERLEEIIRKADVYSREIKAAETATALGGCYLKVNWDANFKPFPLFSVAQSDNAIPEFHHGFLRRVLFHTTIESTGVRDNTGTVQEASGTYLRHLEYHEPGQIQHGLYEGTRNNLGDRIPLDEHWKTSNYEPVINTGIDDLLVRYVPNKRPNRLWRTSSLGQSDYQGIEGIMDALDATYTSWIRDLKLAKARLLVPRNMLEEEDGKLKFDVDKSVYVALETAPTEDKKITAQQFDIRSKQHYETAKELMSVAVDNAGYSPQTFGLNIEGRAESGTALRIRERKSVQTKNKKERYFENPLSEIFRLMLEVDNMKGFSEVTPFKPRLTFGPSFRPTLNELADSVDKISRAKAASYEVLVRTLHPDWTEEEVIAEVEKIKDQQGMNVPNPEQKPEL